MNIKDALSFVVGAVARKEYEPELCHLLIRDQKVVAYDGLLSMSSPIPIDLHVKPHAKDMMLAVKACESVKEPISMSVTKAGRLSIKAGKFKAFVGCMDNESDMTRPTPKGQMIDVSAELFDAIKLLAPFMSTDASRPWSRGILISTNSCLVTNNVILIERWHGASFPLEMIIPAPAVEELLRIGEAPIKMQVSENSATFYFEDDRYMMTALMEGSWPTERVQARLSQPASPVAIPAGFFDALEILRPFVDDERKYVYLNPDKITTHQSGEDGAEVEFATGEGTQIFTLPYLQSLDGVAAKIDFQLWPDPCLFYGPKLRGVIIGVQIPSA